jgi:hypothetical protein
MDLDELSRRNVGWYYLDALKAVNKRGEWPSSLTVRERHTLKSWGLVEMIYRGGCAGVGRIPRLTAVGKRVFLDALQGR